MEGSGLIWGFDDLKIWRFEDLRIWEFEDLKDDSTIQRFNNSTSNPKHRTFNSNDQACAYALIWKFENLRIWRFEDLKICPESFRDWEFENLKIWGFEDLSRKLSGLRIWGFEFWVQETIQQFNDSTLNTEPSTPMIRLVPINRKWSDDSKSSDHLTLKGFEFRVSGFEFWVLSFEFRRRFNNW